MLLLASSVCGLFKWRQFEPEMILLAVGLTNDSWRVDGTYIRVKGKWVYLYRAVDSTGATIDFLLSAKRDAAAAERFLARALGGENHPAPRVINTDEHAGYPPAIGPSYGSKPRAFWWRIAGIDRCSTSIIFWNRITGPSNAGCAQANIFVHAGELGVRSPAMKRCI